MLTYYYNCNILEYSVYCPFIVCTLYQPYAEMNFFSYFNGSYLSTPVVSGSNVSTKLSTERGHTGNHAR